MTTHKDVATAV